MTQEVQSLDAVVIQNKSAHKGIGTVELKGHDVDLLSYLVILFAEVELKLVLLVRYTFVFPRTNLECVVSLEVNAA